MAWNFLKKIIGVKEKPAEKILPQEVLPMAQPAPITPAPTPKAEISVKEKSQKSDAEIEKEVRELSPAMLSHVKDPVMREKIKSLAKKMLKDGVDIKSERQIKNWIKSHPEEVAPPATAPKIETYRRDEPKIGRNDPCPCASGKKYKKCC
ncbi:MAG: SEC-C metal-binding domain-containing protein, partial [Elusimicrobia bacterium]|nr:SEC-C metal-binding domain-containing protein [Elusimicrobiota bacterium]